MRRAPDDGAAPRHLPGASPIRSAGRAAARARADPLRGQPSCDESRRGSPTARLIAFARIHTPRLSGWIALGADEDIRQFRPAMGLLREERPRPESPEIPARKS